MTVIGNGNLSIWDIGCSKSKMLDMCDVRNVVSLGCEMLGMCDVRHVAGLGYEMLGMCNVCDAAP